MSRGFGKYRRGTTHHSFHFDTLFKENSNRPSAARSAASVGKWGITSFTSIRTLNGRQENESGSKPVDSAPKPKKFFKSRDTSQDANDSSLPNYQSPSYSPASKKARTAYDHGERKTRGPKKFFSSKNSNQEKVVLTLNESSKRRNSDRSDTSEASKPPIVLRICRGKSQLVNDTDESEKTVSPSSTPSSSASTSPRALRETSNSQVTNRPSNCRITRSARRSMQQDPSSSPVTADTPTEFTMFSPTSKKDTSESDLSPQYVPAEKFEEERRALYASLLKPDSPKSDDGVETDEDAALFQGHDELEPMIDEIVGNDMNDELDTSVEEAMAQLHGIKEVTISEGDERKRDVSEEQSMKMELELDMTEAVEDLPLEVRRNEKAMAEVKEVKPQKKEVVLPENTKPKQEIPIKGETTLMENTGETLETIENIAREIESTKSARIRPVRELRSRTKPKEVKEAVIEPQKEVIPTVTRLGLRGGLRNRNKNASTNVVEENNVDKQMEDKEIVITKEKINKEKATKEKEKPTREKEKITKEKEKITKEKEKIITKEKEKVTKEKEKITKEKEKITKEKDKIFKEKEKITKEKEKATREKKKVVPKEKEEALKMEETISEGTDEVFKKEEKESNEKEPKEKEAQEKELKEKESKEKDIPVVREAEVPVLLPEVGEQMNVVSGKEVVERNIEEDWSTDSDSNSTSPELEVKQLVPDPELPVNEIEKHKDKILDKILEKPPEPPPVKLVISKKKGSIFKSRALVDDDSKKRRARYVHKWIDDKDGKVGGETPVRPPPESRELEEEFIFKDDPLVRVTEIDDDQDKTSVKCTTNDKAYYMVVRNVKKAHQIQEIGEFQEFNDDVEYILDALQESNPLSTRCLSAITLASKCMVPAFRMHVRAHGTVAKFFKALHDATKDQSLGLCTATVMFVLSQDRLNMDLDRDCLELMLNLLESDVSYQQALDVCGLSTSQLEKNKQKVRELCAEIQSQGHAMHLNLDNITTGSLAMETLLSLTSKRAGEWFKEELRELGGLEHIMKTIHECCRQVSDYVVSWTDPLLDKLKKVDRCLRVLENVTQNNEENQTYILKYNDGMMIDTLVSLYKLCDGEIPLYPITDIGDKVSTGTIIREALLVTLKVLINLTHHYRQQSIGSQIIGCKTGIIETSLHLLLQVPNYIPEQKKFELGVLVLMLLINLIQDQEANKKLLMEAKAPSKLESIYSREESAVEALIIQFYDWEACAKIAENKTNAILDGEKDGEDAPHPQNKSSEEFIEETVAKLLQKAGTHMEYTFLASYIVMLVGFLIMENPGFQDSIRQFLRGSNFSDMVELLKKFFNFMNLTASTEASSVCAVKATQRVIKFLEECDKVSAESGSVKQEDAMDVDDRTYL